MRWIIAFLILNCTLSNVSKTQDISISLEYIERVEIVFSHSITVNTHNKRELLITKADNNWITASPKILNQIDLTKLKGTESGLFVEQIGSLLKFGDLNKLAQFDLVLYLPPDMNLVLVNQNTAPIKVNGMQAEIEVRSQKGDIYLKNVAGPIVASSSEGDIHLDFGRFDSEWPSSIISVTGDLLINVPKEISAVFKLMARSGSIYTNLIPQETAGDQAMKKINGGRFSFNNEGTEINLLTTSGDIYLIQKNKAE